MPGYNGHDQRKHPRGLELHILSEGIHHTNYDYRQGPWFTTFGGRWLTAIVGVSVAGMGRIHHPLSLKSHHARGEGRGEGLPDTAGLTRTQTRVQEDDAPGLSIINSLNENYHFQPDSYLL